MASSIGSLVVNMTLNAGAFIKGVDRAEMANRKLNLSMARVERQIDRSAKAFNRSIKNAVSFRTAVATLAGSAGLGLLIKRSVQFADTIGKTADKVGFTVEQLQELRFAADQSGVATQTLDMALQRFSRRVGEVAQGQGELLKTAEQYGIELRDQATGAMRSNIDLLREFAEVIRTAESEQEQLRIAFKLFDSEGAALVNLMRRGADGIDLFRARAQSLGIVMSTGMVREAERANDKMNILAEVLRIKVTSAVVRNAEAIGKLADRLTNSLGPAMDNIIRSLDWMAENAHILAGALGALIGLRIGSAFGIWGSAIGVVVGALGGLAANAAFATEETLKLKEAALEAAEAKILAYEAGGLGSMAGVDNPMRREAEMLREEIARLRAQKNKEGVGIDGVNVGRAPGTVRRGGPIFGKTLDDDKAFLKEITKELKKLGDEGKRVFEATRTPLEIYNLRLAELSELLRKGAISQDTYRRAVERAEKELDDATVTAKDYARVIEDNVMTALERWANGYGSLREVALSALQDIIKQVWELHRAQQAAQQSGGTGGGGGGFLSSLIGTGLSFFGGGTTAAGGASGTAAVGSSIPTATLADGGSFTVDRSFPRVQAGRDNRLVTFAARDRERISVETPGMQRMKSASRGGGDTYVTIHAEGATEGFVDGIMSEMRALNAKVARVDGSIERRSVSAVTAARRRNPNLFPGRG